MLLKLPIMLLSDAPKSPYYAPIMFRAVTLCPEHASTILQVNTQLQYFITLMNVLLELFYSCFDCSIRVYRSFITLIIASSDTRKFPAILDSNKAN